ncbi:MAG: hypothetical protein AAGE01_13180 [Pseudomonadota bacterium]
MDRRIGRCGIVLLAALTVAACSQQEVVLESRNEARVDFSGNWELDYGRSDRLEENVYNEFLQARRQIRRDASLGQRAGPVMIVGSPMYNTASAIVGLGRMAEMISRTPELEIDQDGDSITVNRGEDFPLSCQFARDVLYQVDTLGAEVCGWDDHQLVFRVDLPDGTRVRHRLTLGPDGEHLNVATSVRSRRTPKPFTFNRVYRRYEPMPDPYECKPTLDRGTVCWKIGSRTVSE